MKFVLNKDKVTVENEKDLNSGSINYYEADVEYDETWNDLNIEAVIVKTQNGRELEDKGTSIAVINNKIYIDQKLEGSYFIGFVGYKIEENKKTYQISTNLKGVWFDIGAGEIETTNSEDVPTPTEWEIYIAQIQDMIDNIESVPKGGTTGQVLAKKSNADGDVEWKTIESGSSLPEYPTFDNNKQYVLMLLPNQSQTAYELNWKEVTITGSNQLITSDNFIFKTADGENFILKEEN